MRLTVLGCNGPFPQANGACSGYLVTDEDCRGVMVEMGSGVLGRLIAHFDPMRLEAVVISHWHFDHAGDLGVLSYALAGRKTPLPLYAPADDNAPLYAFACGCSAFDVHIVKPGDSFQAGFLAGVAFGARHPVPALSYRFGSFVYTGDTNTVLGLADFCRGADTLLCDACFLQQEWTEQKPHLSACLAAQLAKEAGVNRLLLTHFRPTCPAALIQEEARSVFPAAKAVKAGWSCVL